MTKTNVQVFTDFDGTLSLDGNAMSNYSYIIMLILLIFRYWSFIDR